MIRQVQLWRFVAVVVIALVPARTPAAEKVFRIGRLSGSLSSSGYSVEIRRRELRAHGYIEGKNLAFEFRYAEEKPEPLAALADELMRLKVDVILAGGPNDDLAASLARPGGNVTGFYSMADVLAGKRLEVLKDAMPKLSRVAVLWYPSARAGFRRESASGEAQWAESQRAARQLGLQLPSMEIGNANQYESAFREAVKTGSGALSVSRHRLTQTPAN